MHGCATIHYLKRNLVEYVDEFFSMKHFITTHGRCDLLPINGEDM